MIEKDFTTFEEQVQLLKDRNLKFVSEETALNALRRFGYYSIINGYNDPYVQKINGEDHYNGATFEQIYSLYTLDRNVRNEVMNAMQEVEDILRTAVAHTLAQDFSADQNLYLKPSNFRTGAKRKSGFKRDDILNKFDKITKDDAQPFKHYREKYGNIPPWILLKGASFGNLVNFIKLLKGKQKNNVIAMVYGVPVSLVESYDEIKNLFMDTLFVCLDFRNRAAHGGRIYNYESDARFRYSKILHENANISSEEYRLGEGHTGLYILSKAIKIFEYDHPAILIEASMDYFKDQHCSIYPDDKDYIGIYLKTTK